MEWCEHTKPGRIFEIPNWLNPKSVDIGDWNFCPICGIPKPKEIGGELIYMKKTKYGFEVTKGISTTSFTYFDEAVKYFRELVEAKPKEKTLEEKFRAYLNNNEIIGFPPNTIELAKIATAHFKEAH